MWEGTRADESHREPLGTYDSPKSIQKYTCFGVLKLCKNHVRCRDTILNFHKAPTPLIFFLPQTQYGWMPILAFKVDARPNRRPILPQGMPSWIIISMEVTTPATLVCFHWGLFLLGKLFFAVFFSFASLKNHQPKTTTTTTPSKVSVNALVSLLTEKWNGSQKIIFRSSLIITGMVGSQSWCPKTWVLCICGKLPKTFFFGRNSFLTGQETKFRTCLV